jgi:glucosamine 6-phosphate synthetase-like amidotransferase/phosphosugar isomerase protein
LCIIPIQILAYKISLSKNINPDMPKNLAKVVTVE